MGEHNVYLDREQSAFLSDGKVARIDDSGRIIVPDTWFSEKVVAYLKDDGIYVEGPGMLSMRCIARIHGNRIYSVTDEGWFTSGKLIGSIDSDGTIQDANERRVGEISGGSPLEPKEKVPPVKPLQPNLPIVAIFVFLIILGIPIMFQIAWMSSMNVFDNAVSACCGALFLICGVVVGMRVLRDEKVGASFGQVLSKSIGAYAIPSVIFIGGLLIFDHSIGTWFANYNVVYVAFLVVVALLIVLPLFLFAVGAPVLLVQTAVTVILKRLQKTQ